MEMEKCGANYGEKKVDKNDENVGNVIGNCWKNYGKKLKTVRNLGT